MRDRQRLPLWIKILQTLFVALLVPVYWYHYGPENYLWFSDIALFVSVLALWRESSLLASWQAVAVAALEITWNVDFAAGLLTGSTVIGLSDYMFQSEYPLYLRSLSLFHVWLPVLLLWMCYRLGYDRRALALQTMTAWVVLPVTYLLTEPADNINWIYGFGDEPQQWLPEPIYVFGLMLAFPLLVYLPSHLLLRWLMPPREARDVAQH